MRKIDLSDVLDIAQYERVRQRYRADILAHKEARRLEVGPLIWFAFETRETMLYQVQEMMRSERMVDEAKIAREIAVYNELIPEKNQLSATMMIALDEAQRASLLPRMTTLPQHTWMRIGDQRLFFRFDERQNSPARFNTVQFVKLTLTPQQAAAFKSSRVVVSFDHPLYSYERELADEFKAVLAYDMMRD